jgi:VanZ family protein
VNSYNRILPLDYWLPVVLWLAAIHFFSTDAFASSETSRIIGPLLSFLFPGMTPAEIESWHGLTRKGGHVAEYFILAALALRCIRRVQPDFLTSRVLCFLFILTTACIDEFHQSLTLFRGASLADVGYDGFGGFAALWLVSAGEKAGAGATAALERRL